MTRTWKKVFTPFGYQSRTVQVIRTRNIIFTPILLSIKDSTGEKDQEGNLHTSWLSSKDSRCDKDLEDSLGCQAKTVQVIRTWNIVFTPIGYQARTVQVKRTWNINFTPILFSSKDSTGDKDLEDHLHTHLLLQQNDSIETIVTIFCCDSLQWTPPKGK